MRVTESSAGDNMRITESAVYRVSILSGNFTSKDENTEERNAETIHYTATFIGK